MSFCVYDIRGHSQITLTGGDGGSPKRRPCTFGESLGRPIVRSQKRQKRFVQSLNFFGQSQKYSETDQKIFVSSLNIFGSVSLLEGEQKKQRLTPLWTTSISSCQRSCW